MKKIIALALAAILCLGLIACGTPEETVADTTVADTAAETTVADTTVADTVADTAAETTVAETAEIITVATLDEASADIKALLDSLKAGDEDLIIAMSGSDKENMDPLLLDMLTAMFSKLEYALGTPVDNGDGTATLPVDITAVSMTSVFTEYMAEAAKHIDDTEEWDADGSYFIELCGSDKVAAEKTSVTVNFEQIDGKWARSANNDEFVNALFGGLLG